MTRSLTGRGTPWIRGTVCGLMTAVGGLGHTLPYLIRDFWTATVLAVIVVFQNTQAVETKLLFMTLTLPNAALLFGTLAMGFAIGALAAGHIISNSKRRLPE